jgi:glycosyltransferase involved in cell wall biosynthesis
MMVKKQVKIVRIQSRIVIGGPALHTICLSDKLNPDLFKTVLVGGSGADDERSMIIEAKNRNISCIEIPELGRDIHFYDDLISFFKVYRIIRRLTPAIVHTHTAKAGAIGRLAAFLAGVPYIFHTFHGHVFTGYFNAFKTRLFIAIERLLTNISTKIIVISNGQKNDIVNKYKIAPEDKVRLIPLGFEWDRVLKGDSNVFNLRDKYGIPGDRFVVAIVGRIVPIKDHALFLRIAEQLTGTKTGNYHFVVIGDGELRGTIENQVKKLGLTHRFTFTGWITNTYSIYRNIDLLLLTSKNEGTPVTIIEALAAGIPVIARKVGGVADIFKFYDTNNLINGDNPLDYIEAIKRIVSKKAIISDEIKEKIRSFYSAQRLVADMEKLYTEMISKTVENGNELMT